MEEHRDEIELVGDCKPMEEAGKGVGLSSKNETLGCQVDVQQKDHCVEDANTVENLSSGVCDVSGSDENPNDGGSDDKHVRADVEDTFETEESGVVEEKDTIEKAVSSDVVEKTDDVTEPETQSNKVDCDVDEREASELCNDVEVVSKTVELVDKTLSVEEYKDEHEESMKKNEEDNNEMGADSEQKNEETVGLNETTDANHSESAQVPEEPKQLSIGETNIENPGTFLEASSAAEICREAEITNIHQKEENGEAMEIDYAAEEQVEKGVLDNDVKEFSGAHMVQPEDVQIAEADRNDSNVVKEMEIDEWKDNVDMASDITGTISSADPANSNNPTEDAAPAEVEPLDHNAFFDPRSDITNYIDFTGVSSWSGNIQDLKIDTGNVSSKDDKKAIDKSEEVATVDCPKEASDAILGSEENQEDKDHQCLDQKTVDQQDAMIEEDDSTREAPSTDPNQKEDAVMEENPNSFDYADDGTDSDIKTNGVKRKADVLSEDSPGEGRKTVSLAKVSFAERPSFKIGACIARAASQMAGSPSVLKGSNFSDETLSVESFVSQLHCAATDPVRENVVSEIAIGFFLDYRNSSVSQQAPPEKVGSKRGRPSDSTAGGTEAFEFEEMGDTYWKDRVIHNGGEEHTPPTEKGDNQVVPVELKPQVKRTRRPYRKRQSKISIPLPPASEIPAEFDENAPAELIMKFSETDTIPPEKSLSKMFSHFGPIRESQTEVDRENNRARIVFRKGTDGETAYNSSKRFNIFGKRTVNYELSYTITETFKVQPYVVTLGEEEEALPLPS